MTQNEKNDLGYENSGIRLLGIPLSRVCQLVKRLSGLRIIIHRYILQDFVPVYPIIKIIALKFLFTFHQLNRTIVRNNSTSVKSDDISDVEFSKSEQSQVRSHNFTESSGDHTACAVGHQAAAISWAVSINFSLLVDSGKIKARS